MAEPQAPSPVLSDLQVAKAVGQIRGDLQEIIDRLEALDIGQRQCRLEVAELRGELKELLMQPQPRPVAPVRTSVVSVAACAGKYSAYTTAVIAIVVQIVSAFRPDMTGPLTDLLKLLRGE